MKKISLIIILGVFVQTGCNEDEFLLESPRDAIYAENLFQTYTGFNSSLNSVYAFMRQLYMRGEDRTRDQLWVQNTDNVMTRTHDINWFTGISPSWSEVSEVYNWLYQIVNTTNMIINRAEGNVDWQGTSAEEDLHNKRSVIGQARVARAWAYRLLIYAFGPVPLNTNEITGKTYSNAWDRTSIDEIKAQMEEDLSIAVEYLDFFVNDQTRIGGAAARHYLGELYLSMGKFQKAVDVLAPLCNSNEYNLVKTRFGRTSNSSDGNFFIDMFRSPYRKNGNTESIFIFANGLSVPGSESFALMNSYIGEYRSYQRIAQNQYWWSLFGGNARCRYHNTPWSMSNEADYNLYAKYKNTTTPRQNYINRWLWENTDGRDNFLYEKNDIRGHHTSVRRFFVYDWNENGVLTDPPIYPVDTAITNHSDAIYNLRVGGKYVGDTIYTYFAFNPSATGSVQWYNKHTYIYSRKWEVEFGITTNDWNTQNDWHTVVHLRLADSYLLFAEALFMNGNSNEAALWINKVRERAGASEISPNQISIDFILDERSRELVSEELRKITLLRTGKYLERTRKYNPLSMHYVQDFHKLYPFPSDAIDANKDKVMDQNLGYGGSTTCDFTPHGYPDE
jgi:starch-binding outer membrane protein, SusD/RagB family